MSHHSSDHPFLNNDDEVVKRTKVMRELLDATKFKGAVGSFPSGKLAPNDEGAIQFGLTVVNGKVVVDFGTPVRSLGMTPQEACDLAGHLVKIARHAARAKGESVALTIV